MSRVDPPQSSRTIFRNLAIVFLVALALRLAYYFEISGDLLYKYPVLDEGHYYSTAMNLAKGDSPPVPYWRPPGLYFALAGIARITGPGPQPARVIQVLISTLSIALVFLLGRKYFSTRVALLAAALMAGNAVLISAAVELKDTNWTLFLDLAALCLFTEAASRKNARWAFIAGIATGLSVLFRPVFLVFVPVALTWLVLRTRDRRWPVIAGAVLLGTALPILPVALENNRPGGPFVLISVNGGVNFFIGNNPDYRRTVLARPGNQWESAILEPARQAGFPGEGAGRDHYYFETGLGFLRGDPIRGAGLLLRKFYLFFNGHEIPRDTDIYVDASKSRVLKLLVWRFWPLIPMGVLIPLALIGLWSTRARSRELSLLSLFLAVQAVTVAAFFVSSRYRVPSVPVLSLFAAAGALSLVEALRTGSKPERLARGAAIALLLIVLNLSTFETRQSLEAERIYFLANAFANEGRDAEALAFYVRAAEIDSTDARPLQALSDRLEARGDVEGAIRTRRRAIRIGPYNAHDRDRLVELLMRQNRRADAARAIHDDIATAPPSQRLALNYFRLGVLRFDESKEPEALSAFRQAASLDSAMAARSVLRWGRDARRNAVAGERPLNAGFWQDLAGLTGGAGW